MLTNITPKSKYIAYLILCGRGDCCNPGIIGNKFYSYSFLHGATEYALRKGWQHDLRFPGKQGKRISTKKLIMIMMNDNCTIYK